MGNMREFSHVVLGGGGDALAKFEPKDVPTMSMTSVGSN